MLIGLPGSRSAYAYQAFLFSQKLMLKKKYGRALHLMNKAVEFDPSAIYYFLRGMQLVSFDYYEAALLDFETAALILKDSEKEVAHLIYLYRAVCLSRFGKNTAALIDIDRAIELAPDMAQAWELKAMMLLEAENYEEAKKAIDIALMLPNDNQRVALEVNEAIKEKLVQAEFEKQIETPRTNDEIIEKFFLPFRKEKKEELN